MTKIYKTYLAQLNPSVGNIKNNLGLVKDSWEKARALNSDLLITPELVVTGYPPEDLLLRPAFIEQIKCPSMLVSANKGLRFNQDIMDKRKSTLSGLEEFELVGNHHVHMETPEEVAALVSDFLARHR